MSGIRCFLTDQINMRNKLMLLFAVFALTSFLQKNTDTAAMKIVSVNGTTSEIICALGMESSIVGVDITSTYPATLDKVVKVGHNRQVSSEGIVALSPSLVVGMENDLKPVVLEQLTASGIKIQLFKQELSVEGTKQLIRTVGVYFNQSAKATTLIAQLDKDIALVKKSAVKKKVLFIYARGTGTMMVSGTGTAVDKIIQLSGGQNAVTAFLDYKPLTSEALIAANPDVILLFDSGLESLGGIDGLLKVQGVNQTNAGKNKKVISMDGQLLTGFGPRLGKAMAELSSQLQ
jgi:iron complex transport system substrate-binding protein